LLDHADPAFAPTLALTLALALVLAAVHVFSPRLVFLDRTPRSIWLSLAGGTSVAYVFVHLLPELAALSRDTLGEAWIYSLALAGLVTFYALEKMVRRSRRAGGGRSTDGGFWLHLGAFAVYNFLIGYLLDEQAREEGTGGLVFYAVAMGVHFVVNDRALFRAHGHDYLARGRWLLAGAALAGWAAGLALEIPEAGLAGAFALLGGSVVLNVIKEELPEERESKLWAFALGAAVYAALLLLPVGGGHG
jgi:hypothetical protein